MAPYRRSLTLWRRYQNVAHLVPPDEGGPRFDPRNVVTICEGCEAGDWRSLTPEEVRVRKGARFEADSKAWRRLVDEMMRDE